MKQKSSIYLPLLSSKLEYHPESGERYTFHIFRNKRIWDNSSEETLEGALKFFENAKKMLNQHEANLKEYYAARIADKKESQ